LPGAPSPEEIIRLCSPESTITWFGNICPPD
jgi:hypothetical protein